MPEVTFRLQPLLKLREADRNRCREELADAYATDRHLAMRADQLHREMNAAKRQNREQNRPGAINVDQLLQSHRYELLIQTQLTQIDQQRQQVGVEIERRREALVEADRELKILEKLRERHAAECRHQQQVRENNALDEIAARRSRSTRGGDLR
jgi:flagellar export protein FliJ